MADNNDSLNEKVSETTKEATNSDTLIQAHTKDVNKVVLYSN
jgi:hypothetical protein